MIVCGPPGNPRQCPREPQDACLRHTCKVPLPHKVIYSQVLGMRAQILLRGGGMLFLPTTVNKTEQKHWFSVERTPVSLSPPRKPYYFLFSKLTAIRSHPQGPFSRQEHRKCLQILASTSLFAHPNECFPQQPLYETEYSFQVQCPCSKHFHISSF